jgi:signal transduction histidine kinase
MKRFVRRRLHGLSLKTRVLMLVAGLLVAGIWALAVQVAAALRADLQTTLSNQLANMVGYVADDFDEAMRLRQAALKDLADSITPELLAQPDRLQTSLDQRGISSLLFPTGVFAADGQGIIVADAGAVIPGRRGRSIADRDYFRESLSGVRAAVSQPHVGRVTQAPTIVLSVPVRDADGTAAGVLAASVNIANETGIFGEIEKLVFGSSGYAIVFSPRDRLVIAATDRSRIMTPIPPRGAVPLMDKRIEEGFEGVGTSANSAGVEVLSANRRMKTTGWIVITAIPTSEAFSPIATLDRHVYLSASAVTVMVALLLWLALKHQLKPLDDAGRAMQRMGDGAEPFAPLPIGRPDEIGRMIKHFNRLVAERQRNERDLALHRDHLQDLVREQTVDVMRAKEDAEAANRAKSEFLAKMSFDLRTPLQTVLSYSRLGQAMNGGDRQQVATYFANIAAAGRELLDLINDLLDLSKLEAGKMDLDPHSGDLGEIARAVGRDLEPALCARGLHLTLRIRDDTPRAMFDSRRISQVVRNLYANAIKFSPSSGGEIRVDVSPAALPAAGGELCSPGEGVRLAVADQGIGIPAAELGRLFEKFGQGGTGASTGGSGLGLAICKEIVEAHGGSIRAANDVHGGAIFEVVLPVEPRRRGKTAELT